MLQFLIGLSISAVVVAVVVAIFYWSEQPAFRRSPTAAAILLIAIALVGEPLLGIIYAFRYIKFGREHALRWLFDPEWDRPHRNPRTIAAPDGVTRD